MTIEILFDNLLRLARSGSLGIIEKPLNVVAVALTVLFGIQSAAAQPAAAGVIFVVDYNAGIGSKGALFRVAADGSRTIVSDFGDPNKGPEGRDPFALTFDDNRNIMVIDQTAGTICSGRTFGCGALFRVNPTTGTRELVSDFGNPAQGPTAVKLYGIATRSNGRLLVTSQGQGLGGLLFEVDANTGTRTVLSDFSNTTQGPLGQNPSGVAVESTGRILVIDPAAEPYPRPTLFAIDPATGNRTVLLSNSASNPSGPVGIVPIDVEPASATEVWVLDQVFSGPYLGALFKVNLTSGIRTVISDFTTTTQGPPGFNVNDIKVAGNGSLLVVDFDAGTNNLGALFRVDPVTGVRTYFSDFGNAAQGPLGNEPSGVAIAPAPPPPPAPGNFLLTVSLSGNGGGTVTSSPAGISCGLDCSASFPANTLVTLTATPDVGSAFIRWSGDADCADGVVQMTASLNCTAVFNRQIGAPRLPNLRWVRQTEFFLPVAWESALPLSMVLTYSVTNNGFVTAPYSKFTIYLSTDPILGPEDRQIGFYNGLGPISPGQEKSAIGPGGIIPAGTPIGRYYIFAVVDAANEIKELNEKDNSMRWMIEICRTGLVRKGCSQQ